MKKRLHNPNLAKIHSNYTAKEVARLYGVFKGTVRAWIKVGLPTINDKQPMLILGSDLAALHHARKPRNKQKYKPGEMHWGCRHAPKKPAGDRTYYQVIADKIGNLEAFFPDCDQIMNRYVSLSRLEQVRGKITITLLQIL